MAVAFNRSIYFHQNYLIDVEPLDPIIAREQPDIVIHTIVENSLLTPGFYYGGQVNLFPAPAP